MPKAQWQPLANVVVPGDGQGNAQPAVTVFIERRFSKFRVIVSFEDAANPQTPRRIVAIDEDLDAAVRMANVRAKEAGIPANLMIQALSQAHGAVDATVPTDDEAAPPSAADCPWLPKGGSHHTNVQDLLARFVRVEDVGEQWVVLWPRWTEGGLEACYRRAGTAAAAVAAARNPETLKGPISGTTPASELSGRFFTADALEHRLREQGRPITDTRDLLERIRDREVREEIRALLERHDRWLAAAAYAADVLPPHFEGQTPHPALAVALAAIKAAAGQELSFDEQALLAGCGIYDV